MRILCLGGTGNLSAECARRLLARGDEVTLLTRGRTPVPTDFVHLTADRHDPAAVEKALEGLPPFDAVCDFTTYNEADALQMLRHFRGRCRQYVFVSTVCVYARPPKRLPVTEEEPQGNVYSPYGQDKQRAEACFMEAFRKEGFPVTVVRPSHTYSERWLPNPVTSAGYTLAWRLENHLPVFIHDDGQNLWTLTDVRDFAVGFCGLVGLRESIGEAYQITSDMVLTWNQIMAEICLALGVTDPVIRHIPTERICAVEPMMTAKLLGDKATDGVFDCAKVKRAVPEFQCRIPFRDGVRDAVRWFRERPERQQPDSKVNAIFENILANA